MKALKGSEEGQDYFIGDMQGYFTYISEQEYKQLLEEMREIDGNGTMKSLVHARLQEARQAIQQQDHQDPEIRLVENYIDCRVVLSKDPEEDIVLRAKDCFGIEISREDYAQLIKEAARNEESN